MRRFRPPHRVDQPGAEADAVDRHRDAQRGTPRATLTRLAALMFAATTTAACATSRAPDPVAAPTEIASIPTSSRVLWFAMARTQPIAATVHEDGTLRLLSLPNGAERRVIDLGSRAIDVLAISPDGATVAVGDHTGGVTAWAAATGEVRLDRRLRRYPGVLVFSNDGTKLATAAQGDAIEVIDLTGGRDVTLRESPAGGTMALAFAPDDRFVATGDGDTAVRVYNTRTGRQEAANRDFRMVPLAVTFTHDGRSVIASSGDRTVTFIEAATGRAVLRMDRTAQPVAWLSASPDGTWLVTGFLKGDDVLQTDRIVVHRIATGEINVDWLPPSQPSGGGWTHDNRLLVAIASPQALHLWRLK